MENAFHVMPVGDLKEHLCSKVCPCQPEVRTDEGGTLIIHNSYDGREFFEDEQGNARKGH